MALIYSNPKKKSTIVGGVEFKIGVETECSKELEKEILKSKNPNFQKVEKNKNKE